MNSFELNSRYISCHHGIDEKPVPTQFNMHAHEKYELYCFISGQGSYMIEGHEYSLQPYDLLLLRPAETHMVCIRSGQPYERISFHFSPELFCGIANMEQLLRPFDRRALGQLNRYHISDFDERCMKYLLRSAVRNTDNAVDQCVSFLLPILYELSVAYERRSNEHLPELGNETAIALVQYINDNLFSELSLEQLSNRFFLSQSQLGRVFRQSTGSSVWEYITIKRLLNARNLILTGQPAGEVGIKCGFSDYSAFYRAYKKRFSVSPKRDYAENSTK